MHLVPDSDAPPRRSAPGHVSAKKGYPACISSSLPHELHRRCRSTNREILARTLIESPEITGSESRAWQGSGSSPDPMAEQ